MVTAGVLLAAGASRRMGKVNKLLLPVGGIPIVRRVARAMLEGGLSPVVVVLGADGAAVRSALEGLPVRFVTNPRHEEGMGTSVAAGVGALGAKTAAAAVVLGDLPGLRPREVRAVADGFAASRRGIALPVREGRRGHPVVFDLGRYRGRLTALGGDEGARALLAEHPEDVVEVEVEDAGVLEDLDTPGQYRRLETGGLVGDAQGSAMAGGGEDRLRDPVILRELNDLWGSVYPWLAGHLLAAAGSTSGRLLELGPFSGGISVEVLVRCEGFEAVVQDEGDPVLRWAEVRARSHGVGSRLRTRRDSLVPLPWPDGCFDVVVVRGAFFFLGPDLLREVHRVLRPGGFGWVGGGYGPGTPEEVIRPMADLSRQLNGALGKRWVSAPGAAQLVEDAGLRDNARVSGEGGLWIEVRG
ncbi:MAG: NTP transferase domain-containing protein [Deferrisomatales bacterium]